MAKGHLSAVFDRYWITVPRNLIQGFPDDFVWRAALLADLLADAGLTSIHSTDYSRTRETAQAVAERLGLEIKLYDPAEPGELLDALLETGARHLLIGHSKGYTMSRRLKRPLIRVGFPVHDRVDGSRMLHLGYHGAQQLFDRIANAVLERKQADSSVGYSYL